MISKLGSVIKRDIKANYSGILGFCAVMLSIELLTYFSVLVFKVESNGELINIVAGFSGFTFSAAIAMFVLGIVTIRENLRLLIQNGVGRKTAILSEFITNLLISFVFAVFGETSIYFFAELSKNKQGLNFTDLYELMFESIDTVGMPFVEHIKAVLFMTALFFLVSCGGMLISLVFLRLSKIMKIVVGVGTPILLLILIPISISAFGWFDWLGRALQSVLNFASNPTGAIVVLLSMGIITAIINWFIVQRAAIITGTAK